MAAFASAADEAGGRTLAARITTAPQLSAPELSQKRLDAWLAEVDGQPAGAALQRLFASHPQARALILGLADGSPHLWDLASADPARLARLLESDPEVHFDAVLADTVAAIAATRDEAQVMA